MKPPTTPREMIAHLQHELSVANNWIEHHQNHVDDLIKENAALRVDKERLDWLEQSHKLWEGKDWLMGPEFISRAAIDSARKDAKP